MTTSSNGTPTAVISTPGSGYKVGDTITVAPPAGNTGTFFTFQIESLADPVRIPATIGNQTTPTLSWTPNASGPPFNNLATTGGGGTGLTVNVTTDNNGKPTAVINASGSGYQLGDTLTVAPPAGNAGSTFTFQIESFADPARIPLTIGNQSYLYNWAPNQTYTNVATTSVSSPGLAPGTDTTVYGTPGNGTGLTVDVTTDQYGNPTVSLHSPGTGYANGDTVEIVEPGSGSYNSSYPVAPITISVQSIEGTGSTPDLTPGDSGTPSTMGVASVFVPVVGNYTVTSVTLNSRGSGYTSAPNVTFSGGGGTGAVGIATISGGVVTSVLITNFGSGYTSAPTVTFSGGGATTQATGTANITGYTSAPSVAFIGGGGTGAAGTAILTETVTSVTLNSGGSGYTSAPNVIFSGGGGTGAAGTAILSGGVVTSVRITNVGSGYTSAPTVTFSGGGATTQATGTANITGIVTGVNITNPGSGYTSAPTVSFTGGGGGSGAQATANLGGLSTPSPFYTWTAGAVYRDVATTALTGSGSGMTVNVTVDNGGNPTLELSSPGTGYALGDIILIKEPLAAFSTASTAITFTVTGLQTNAGGDITLSAEDKEFAAAWASNYASTSITVNPNAVIEGRNVSILSVAENNDTLIPSQTATGFSTGLLGLLNFRLEIGATLAQATAHVTLAAGSSIVADGGNVLTEAYANAAAVSYTAGLYIGFGFTNSVATATVDVEGSVVSDTGSVGIDSIVNNTANSTVNNQFNAYITGAYTNVQSTATTTIGKSAVVTAGGDANVWATINKTVTTAISGQNPQAPFAFGFLWSDDNETAQAYVNGTVTSSNGNVNVIAQTIGGSDGENANIQIGNLAFSNNANHVLTGLAAARTVFDAGTQNSDFALALQSLVGSILGHQILTKINDKITKLTQPASFVGHSGGSFLFLVSNDTNTATATISGTVNAGGNVQLEGNVSDTPSVEGQAFAYPNDAQTEQKAGQKFVPQSAVVPPKAGQSFVTIAVTFGNYVNNSDAEVESGASVNAGGSILVSANTQLPYSLPWSNITPNAGGLTGGGGLQGFQFLFQELGGDLGSSGFFTSFTQTQARGTKTGVAFSVGVLELTTGATAQIDSGAMINQATPVSQLNSAQTVSVLANTNVETVNLVGVIPELTLPLLFNLNKLNKGNNSGTDNGKGNNNGVGGSGSAVLYTPTTLAIIESGAQVNASSLNVQAQAQTRNITLGVAGGTAQNGFSVNGVVTYVSMDDTTTAQIAVGATVATTGPVIVYADDNPLNVNIAGGVSIGTSVGVGVTVGINDITRNTQALIGNQVLTLGGGTFTPDTGVNNFLDTIDLGYGNGFGNGDQVIYSDNGDDPIQGLSDGGFYYVWTVSPTTVTLGRTAAEAEAAAAAAQGVIDTGPSIAFDYTALGSDKETINLGYDDGFVTGDAVQYHAGSGVNLFGLTDGTTYYVIRVDATHVKLASTFQDAQNLTAIQLTKSTAGSGSSLRLALDATGNTGVRDSLGRVFSPAGSQKLSNNATSGTFTLTVTVNGTPETTGPIAYNADASVVQTALNKLNGVSAQVVNAGPDNAWIISGAVVNYTDSLTGGHSTLPSYTGAVTSTYDSINVGYVDGFTAGQAVYYSAGNDPVIPGLTNNTVYYVVPDVSNPDAFQLAATSADATLPTPKVITITPTATSGSSSGFGAIFDPSSAVSSTNPTQLDLGYDDGFSTGQAVIYSAGGGTPIGVVNSSTGLTDGGTYYVTVVNSTTVELSTNPTNLAGTMIQLDPSKATGTQHSLRVAINPQTAVTGGDTTTVSTINLGYNAGFVTGDQVYYNDGGGNNIGGLANENAYYVIVVTAGTPAQPDEVIRLASTLANAMSGVYVNLDATTASGLQSLARPFQADPTVAGNQIQVPDANVYQNKQAVVYHDGGGNPIGGLTDGTTYYVNVVDNTHITLSLTPGGPVVTLNAAVATGTDHSLSAPSTSPGSLDAASNETVVKATNEGVFVTVTLAAAKVGNPPPAVSSGASGASSGAQWCVVRCQWCVVRRQRSVVRRQ